MIKAEIITDASRYEITLVDFDSLVAADAFVGQELMKTDEAKFFCLEAILTIDLVNSKIKSYKVWASIDLEERFGKVQPGNDMQGPPEGTPYEWGNYTHFLGQRPNVSGLAVDWGGKTYYMPLMVNRRPAHDVVNAESLEAIMQQIVSSLPIRAIAVMPPPVTLVGSEAAGYLVDFAQQHNQDPVRPGEVTARAAGSVLE